MKLVFVEPNDSTQIWTGNPAEVPEEIVRLWLPDMLTQEIVSDEGGRGYEKCAELSEVLNSLRSGEDADACWDEGGDDGKWCGFEWRNEDDEEDEEE